NRGPQRNTKEKSAGRGGRNSIAPAKSNTSVRASDACKKNRGDRNGALRRWIRCTGAEAQSRRLSEDGRAGRQALDGARRPSILGMHRRRREARQGHVVSAKRAAEG